MIFWASRPLIIIFGIERCEVCSATVRAALVIPGTLAIWSNAGAAGYPLRGIEHIPHRPADGRLERCQFVPHLHFQGVRRLVRLRLLDLAPP
jgi:hypothetical protein